MLRILVIFCALTLSGCNWWSVKDDVPAVEESIQHHPNRPAPVRAPTEPPEWLYVRLDHGDGEAGYYALRASQAVDLVVYLEDVLRYLEGQSIMLCHYRKDLQEPECDKNF